MVPQHLSGVALRDIIKKELRIPSKLLASLKRDGIIEYDGKRVNVDIRVSQGGRVRLVLPDEEGSETIVPVNMPLDILYEDEDILAVNKSADMPTHPSMHNYDNTLGNAVMYYYRGRNFVFRPVNRLDRDTTGVVIIAKNRLACARLSEQMTEGVFQKTYFAKACGIINDDHGFIDAPIAREQESVIKRCVRDDGKRALTEYEVLERNFGENTTLVKVTLHTGRTHQIRVHFSHIGHPLLYDFLYGNEVKGKTVLLHCGSITFEHPTEKKKVCIKAPIPFI